MDEFAFADPGSLAGQLERGRGVAVRRVVAAAGAAEVVYRCVVEDSRWDRKVEERDSYLAGWIIRLGLPVAPLERHLSAATDAEDIWLCLEVLGQLAFAGRWDAAELLRRYALDGRFWSDAVEAIGLSGSWKLPGVLDGLADGVAAGHSDADLAAAVGSYEPWLSFARSQPRIAELVDARPTRRRPITGSGDLTDVYGDTDALMRHVYACGGRQRRETRHGARWKRPPADSGVSATVTPPTPDIATQLATIEAPDDCEHIVRQAASTLARARRPDR